MLVNRAYVTNKDTLGLLDKYEDWCNKYINEINNWVTSQNNLFEKRKEETQENPTEKETSVLSSVIEEISKITIIKNKLLRLKITENTKKKGNEKETDNDENENEDDDENEREVSSDLDL